MGETGGVIAQPTPAAASPTTEKLPGLIGIWIGIALIVIGTVAGVVLVVRGASTLLDNVEDLQRVPISGGTIEINEPDEQSVYLERQSFTNETGFSTGTGTFAPVVTVLVSDPSGMDVFVEPRSSSETYSWNGREGVLVASFDATEVGTYTVQIVRADDLGAYDTIAVGRALDFGGLAGILGGVFGGGLIVVIGIVVIIISAVRRGKAKRRALAARYGQGPGPGAAWGGGTPAGPGWAPPPVPAPGGYGAPSPVWTPPPPPGPSGGSWTPPAPPTAAPPAGPGWVPPPAPPGTPPAGPFPGPPSNDGPIS